MGRVILLPIDFKPGSDQALAWAADIVEAGGGTLEVLHVVPRPHQLDPFFRAGLIPERTVEWIRARAAARLAKLLRKRRVHYCLRVTEGEPAARILEEIRRLQPDLVVVGTHARRGAARLFLGSVAEKVIRAAEAPVLTVRHA